MDLSSQFEAIVALVTSVFGVVPIRVLPHNLRTELTTPGTALGWDSAEPDEDEDLGAVDFIHLFQFAYAAQNERSLMTALELLPTFADNLPRDSRLSNVERVRNTTESKALDYVFTASISIREG